MSETKFCYNCRFYKPNYTKGYIKFDILDVGMCARSSQTVEKHNACDYFSCKHYARIDRKAAALNAITENLNTLSEIKQILEEDDEEVLEEMLIKIKEQKKKKGLKL